MQPIIGITTYGRNEKDQFHLYAKYVEALTRAKATVVLIPPLSRATSSLLSTLNGIVLSGGGDIHPEYYQGSYHETLYGLDKERDEAEIHLAKQLIKNNLPTLAICRGMQIINVALGGNLHAHLPDVYDEIILHRQLPHKPINNRVTIQDESSILAKITNKSYMDVSCWHHQAVNQLGAGLIATARTSDGVIEAIELPTHPWLLGVQWHPELDSQDDQIQQQLFNHFVIACKTLSTTRK